MNIVEEKFVTESRWEKKVKNEWIRMLLLLMRVSFSFDFISIDCFKIKANRIWIEF